MAGLNNIVSVSVSRETTTVARTSFGIPAIISEFATSKTSPAFVRHRFYASLAEMTADGWAEGDEVYDAAVLIFSQNPKVDQIMVGRKDSADATWSAALTAIQVANDSWYTFSIIPTQQATVVFSADFVSLNSIAGTVAGTAITPVVFATSHDVTMDLLVAEIESSVAGATVTLTDEAGDNRTFTIDVFGKNATANFTVTLGATQATDTVTLSADADIKSAASWTETQKKIFFYSDSAVADYDTGSTTDLGYFMKAQNYDRTVSIFYSGDDDSYIEEAWQGECLPFDPGSQTWAFKTLAGISAYSLTSAQSSALIAKNYNTYTVIGGVSITRDGKVASGDYIDVIRGIDWIESTLQETIFTNLVNVRKIPYDDTGITLIVGLVQSVLDQAARKGIIDANSIVVTAPKYADIPSADKLARNLPDVTFTAVLTGAIQKVTITGTVTV